MSAVGVAVQVTDVTAPAGVAIPGAVGSVSNWTGLVSTAAGTAVDLTTVLTLESRANSTAPWVAVVGTLNLDASPLNVAGAPELRVRGTVAAGDSPVTVQLFGFQ